MNFAAVILKNWKKIVLVFFIVILSTTLIHSNLKIFFSQKKQSKIELNYKVNYNSMPINLNIWESEMYYAAIPVQQMIGNLVYYSNFGRYELRLAKSWKRLADNLWVVDLKSGASCENGEKITAESFVKSISRSLFIMSSNGGTPVLKNLIGYEKFVRDNQGKSIFNLDPIQGLRFNNDQIIFEFDKPIRDGVLQILSFAPYGYICSENLNSDGSWKDSRKIISSGAYRLKEYINSNYIVLEKNSSWIEKYGHGSPDIVHYIQGIDTKKVVINDDSILATIADSFTELSSVDDLIKYAVVQEYFKGIVLGNFETGVFSNLKNRRLFRKKFLEFKNEIVATHPEVKFTNSIYPSQDLEFKDNDVDGVDSIALNGKKINIMGNEPKIGTRNWLPWSILKKTLDYFGVPYQFSKSSYSRDDLTDNRYDLRLVGPSVGGGVEAWVIDVMFCSKFNASFPDPTGKICNLINEYNQNKLADKQLAKLFLEAVDEDSLILPFSQFGVQLYLSKNINLQSVSPMISVIRFDQIEINDEKVF